MHIPSGDTALLELVTFQQALEAANTPSDEYDIQKWLYAPNFYCDYRYILGTRGSNPLICIGINPSTAKPNALDNTLKSVERIALGNGYDSFIMFNVYAQRATNPDAMEKTMNPLLHAENMKAFRYVLSPPSGQPGAASLKSGSTCPSVWQICLPSAANTAHDGTAPVPSAKRGIPITRCICARTRFCVPSTRNHIWLPPPADKTYHPTLPHAGNRRTGGIYNDVPIFNTGRLHRNCTLRNAAGQHSESIRRKAR